MDTILVLLPRPSAVRNMLFTGVVERLLQQKDVRVVVLTNVANIESYYHESFGPTPDRLVFEQFPLARGHSFSSYLKRSLDTRFFRIFDESPFNGMKTEWKFRKRLMLRTYLVNQALSMPFPSNKSLFQLLDRLYRWWPLGTGNVRRLFEKYRPSLVFSDDTYVLDVYNFLKLARKRNIPTVAMVLSWDALSMSRLVFPCDKYIVWNHVEREELRHFYEIPDSDVSITGIPQMDLYAQRPSEMERSAFIESLGLDPHLPTVLFATSPPFHYPQMGKVFGEFVDRLLDARPGKVQVICRVHPQDAPLSYEPFLRPGVVLQVPGRDVRSNDGFRLFDGAAIPELRDTLVACTVLVNAFSTMIIDGVAAGTPVVNIAFDSSDSDFHFESIKRSLQHPHQRPVIESGAVPMAYNIDEVVTHVLRYIDDPSLHRAERAKLVETVCYKVDGHSGERVASYLQEILNAHIGRDSQAGRAQEVSR